MYIPDFQIERMKIVDFYLIVLIILGILSHIYIGVKVLAIKVRLIFILYIIAVCAYAVVLISGMTVLISIFSFSSMVIAIMLHFFI